ncbi:MAG: aspartate aminotransferase family protein [Planctomycetes bacterium]|nr:aspartate aminotransferase family protein [Planctomycetota bacterium]
MTDTAQPARPDPRTPDPRTVEARHVIGAGARLPLEVVRGEGAWVHDRGGARYLDLYGGHAVTVLGHCHPEVTRAVQEQAGRLLFYSSVTWSALRAEAAERLVRCFPPNLEKVFFVNSGSEANENALKLARRFRDRRKVITFRGGFHGRTYGAGSVTALAPYDRQHKDAVPGTIVCRWGDLDEVRAKLGGDVAAVIIEAVQSLQGCRTATREFLQGLEDLCRARAAALILDEVQTTPARCGAPSASTLFGITPHLVTTAKGIANGVPCAAVLVDKGLSETIQGPEVGSTFGGGPLAMAACAATLRVIEEGRLWERAARLGERLRERLRGVPGVVEVRGLGLLVGVVLDREAKPVQAALRERARVLVAGAADPHVLRLFPPVTIGEDELDQGLDALRDALAGA